MENTHDIDPAKTDSPSNARIAFLHIPRTAGTSLTEVLTKHWPRHLYFRNWEYFQKFPKNEVSDVNLVAGHFRAWQLDNETFAPFRVITVLRDPLARFISSYRVGIRHAAVVRSAEATPAMQFASRVTFFEWFYSRHGYSRHEHLYALGLNGGEIEGSTPLDRLLGRAKTRLDRMVVGTTDRLDQYASLLERTIGIPKVPVPRSNSTDALEVDLVQLTRAQIAAMRDVLAPDYALYRYARERFDRLCDEYLIRESRLGAIFERSYRHFRGEPKTARASPPTTSRPKKSPLDCRGRKLTRWRANDSFDGSGWSNLQCPDGLSAPPHRWTMQHVDLGKSFLDAGGLDPQSLNEMDLPSSLKAMVQEDATFSLLLDRNANYLLLFDVYRFMTPDQVQGFALLADGIETVIAGPTPTERSEMGGGLFAARLDRRPDEECRLTFHVDVMKSFSDTNSADPDARPRGLALSSMIVVRLDTKETAPDVWSEISAPFTDD